MLLLSKGIDYIYHTVFHNIYYTHTFRHSRAVHGRRSALPVMLLLSLGRLPVGRMLEWRRKGATREEKGEEVEWKKGEGKVGEGSDYPSMPSKIS